MLSATRSHALPRVIATLLVAVAGGVVWVDSVEAQNLRGSTASMDRQNRMARVHDFTYIETPARVRYFADQGWLVPVSSGRSHLVKGDVSFPYARPEVELFVQRL